METRVTRVPALSTMYERRQDHPPMGEVPQLDTTGHGEWIFTAMPNDPDGIEIGEESKVAAEVMRNLAKEYPVTKAEAENMQIWLDEKTDVFVNYKNDTKRLVSRGILEKPGGMGKGLIVKLEWHRRRLVKINSGALTHGRGAAQVVSLVAEKRGISGSFTIKKGEIVLRLPESSTYGPHLFHGSAWMPRPFVARFMLAASASGTGKKDA